MAKKDAGRTVAIVGAGSLAHALAKLLPTAGYQVQEIVIREGSSRRASAAKLARNVGAKLTTLGSHAPAADIVWLAVSDAAIQSVAGALAPQRNWTGTAVLHSSGALSSGELRSLRSRGAKVASVHPMMTFVPGRAPQMKGVAWTLEGDPAAVAVARTVVQRLGGVPLRIQTSNKPLYHAFGAFLSPLLVVHLEVASRMALAAGIRRKDLAAVMRPIVEQTLHNFFAGVGRRGGTGAAFSGPLIRGDVATIGGHLRALKSSPAARRLYLALVGASLKSDLPIRNRAAIERLMSES